MKISVSFRLTCIGILLFACQTPPSSNDLQLSTIEKQRSFLETIYDLDQQVRKESTTTQQTYGLNSPEYKAVDQKMRSVDTDNLNKVEQYLKTYGHPTLKEHGEKATRAPWIVIHHAMGGVPPRERNFKYLYQAWKNKDLENGQFTFYLNRMYEKKFNERLRWNRPFKVQEEVDSLVQLLNLQNVVADIKDGK